LLVLAAATTVAVIVSPAQLARFAALSTTPVFWAGPRPGVSYELTSLSGRVYVRYLPRGVAAGDQRAVLAGKIVPVS
jgi:hypothetical protein